MSVHRRTGRRWVAVCCVCAAAFGCVQYLSAQTVRPVIAEYQEKARGRFDLVNETVVPLNVVLEARSFSVNEDGSPEFRPLDKEIHVKLSQMSFRIPPQQTHYVFYEATADRYPAWFVIYATFAGLPRQSGLNVQIELPHTVYLLQKKPLEQPDVRVNAAAFEPGDQQVVMELENTGERCGRVLEVEVTRDRQKEVHAGFPLMPHSRRKLSIAWRHDQAPRRVLVRFQKFRLELPLEERRN